MSWTIRGPLPQHRLGHRGVLLQLGPLAPERVLRQRVHVQRARAVRRARHLRRDERGTEGGAGRERERCQRQCGGVCVAGDRITE